MKLTTVFLFLLFVAAAVGQPVISPGGVTNIASAAPDGLLNSGLAPGSIFVVNGTGLGAPNPTPLNLFQNATYPLPTSAGLNGTTIQLTPTPGQGPQPTVTAIMLYESPNMLAAIVPSATRASLTYAVTVTYNGQTSAPLTVHVLARAFGQFTYGQIGGNPGIGYGPGFIYQLDASGNLVINRFNSPAVAGQSILLFGTGLGAVSGDESQGPTNGSITGLTALDFTVYIGGKIATFAIGQDYIGRFISNGVSYAGVDIIEVQIPQSVQGCYVPVAVVAGGVTSNITTMSIDPSGTYCNDPIIGYSQADLQQIHNDQMARIGTVSVGTLKGQAPNGSIVRSDSVTAGFVSMTALQFDTAPGAAPSAGGCTVTLVGPNSQPLSQTVLGTPIDAGPAINLNGPDGAQQIAQTAGQLSYTALSSTTTALVDTGAFSFDNGGGGADVGAFQGSFNIPAAPQGIQGGGAQIPTNSNLVIGWSAADANSLVEVIGVSGDPNTGLAAVFQCTAAASTKAIQIPSYVLSWLPTTNSSFGLLSVVTIGQTRFQAPGLEAGYFSYQVGDTAAVQFIPRSTNVKE